MANEIPQGPVHVSEPLPDAIRAAIGEFNAGDYYPCHDTIEAHWVREVGEQRVLYQGILQVGIAFHHIENGNWRGAIKMLERGIPKLRPFAPACQGIEVAPLIEASEKIEAQLQELGEERIEEFSLDFPRIQLKQEKGE